MKWYYTKNAQQFGPIETEDLKYLYATGKLDPEELIWNENMPLWLPANQVPDIASPAPNNPTPDAQLSNDPVLNYQAPTQPPQIPLAKILVPQSNPQSRASVIIGIISLLSFCFYYLTPILGLLSVIIGIAALKNTRKYPGKYPGKADAIIGIILGLLGIILGIYLIRFYSTWTTREFDR